MGNIQSTHSDLYSSIASFILEGRQQLRTAVNSTLIITYWNIGRLIVEDEQQGSQRAEYGKKVIEELAKRLTGEFGKGFDYRNLQYIKKFYTLFPQLPNVNAVGSQSPESGTVNLELSWTHYRHLLKVESAQARLWYMQEAVKENWSTRSLERQINSFYYDRLLASTDKTPVTREAKEKTHMLTPRDVLKDPYVLEFLQLKNRPHYTEGELESALIDELQTFLLELGSGFSFVARQKHFDLDGDHFYIDLVFYNFKLKCFVLIDLKRGKLTHQDIGQMDTYIRIYEDKIRGEDDNPTIGLILCSDKNEAVAKYSVLADGEQMFASKYQFVLPKVEELEAEIRKELDSLTGES